MAIKLEAVGGTLYIKDTLNGDEILFRVPISQNTWIDTDFDPVRINSDYANFENESYDLDTLVDSTGTPFTLETLNEFIDENFQTASGGSGATEKRIFLDETSRDTFFVDNTSQLIKNMTIFIGSYDLLEPLRPTKMFSWGGKTAPNTYMPSEWDDNDFIASRTYVNDQISNIPVPPTPPDLTGYVRFSSDFFNPALGEFPIGEVKGTVYNIITSGTVDGVSFTTADLLMQIADVSNPFIYSENWIKIPSSSVTSWGGEEGVITDSTIITMLESLGFSMGASTDELPVITSPFNIALTTGDSLHYQLESLYGVSYSWDFSNVTGITTVNGSNDREIIGGSSLNAGVYTMGAEAINYNGSDLQTITLTVSNPPFNNTKSVKLSKDQHIRAINPVSMMTTLGRFSNGMGVLDAWTISLWFKPGTHLGGAKQTLFYFGGIDHDNDGHIWIYYKGDEQAVYLEYGSKNNYLRFKTDDNTLGVGVWKYLNFKYDGGTTGVNSGDINDYYSRFEISINNVIQTTTNSNANFGWDTSIMAEIMEIGKRSNGNDWLKDNCKIDELYIFDVKSTEDLYNGGVPFDVSTLITQPTNGYRMGDGDVYPFINDIFGAVNTVMMNMSANDIVNDVP